MFDDAEEIGEDTVGITRLSLKNLLYTDAFTVDLPIMRNEKEVGRLFFKLFWQEQSSFKRPEDSSMDVLRMLETEMTKKIAHKLR